MSKKAMKTRRTPVSDPGRGRRGPMAAGLLMAVAALFMLPMTVRETSTAVNYDGYILDELELTEFNEGHGRGARTRVEGRLLSSGKPFVTTFSSLVGLDLDRLRELKRENKVKGHRVSVRNLAKPSAFWAIVDRNCQFRVRTPDDFDNGFPVVLVAVNFLFAFFSVICIRRGIRPREDVPGRKMKPGRS